MNATLLLLGVLACPPSVEDPVESAGAADRVLLRDGTTLLGQVLPTRAARVEVVVRRAWAEQHVPDRFLDWDARDHRSRDRAREERINRLRRWQADRNRRPLDGLPDPIAEWLDLELDRLDDPADEAPAPLLVVSIDRRDISQVDRQPEDRRRMLRQGWRAGFDDVETMPIDRLRAGLQARGFALSEVDPAPIDDLLPTPVESDRRWLARRASTEVLLDPDLHLVRFGNLVMPDPGTGGGGGGRGAVNQAQMAGVVGGLLGDLLGAPPSQDPMIPHLERIGQSGRVGVVVTALELSPGLDRVAVQSMLLVRTGPSRWERAAWRRAEVRPGDLPAAAGRDLAQDPQIEAAFNLLEGLGVGGTNDQSKQLGLTVGAATQQALSRARSALDADLRSAALRLDRREVVTDGAESPR